MSMNDRQLKAVKIKIYPSKQQQLSFNKLFGCYRFVFNSILTHSILTYEKTGKSLSWSQKGKFFTNSIRKEHHWIQEHNTKVLGQAIIDLENSYKRFFKNGNGFPKFKSKHSSRQSARFPRQAISKKCFTNGRLTLTREYSDIRFKCSKRDRVDVFNNREHIKSITVSKDKVGGYWASVLIEMAIIPKQNPIYESVGLDLGLTHLQIDSRGNKIDNPRIFIKSQKKLKNLQQKKSRQVKGSNGYNRTKLDIARLHKKIRNQRMTKIHQMTSKYVSENQTIIIENLNVSGMMKNHNLAKYIQDASWGTIERQYKYKCDWYSRDFVQVDRWYPSSKLTYCCGYYINGLVLSDRIIKCPNCGEIFDRDINAAKNIEREGLMFFDQS